jgi:hypothetical protein
MKLVFKVILASSDNSSRSKIRKMAPPTTVSSTSTPAVAGASSSPVVAGANQGGEGLSRFLNSTTIHVASELLVLSGLTYYFYQKTVALQTDLEKTQERLSNVENALGRIIRSLNDPSSSSTAIAPHTQLQTTQQSPNAAVATPSVCTNPTQPPVSSRPPLYPKSQTPPPQPSPSLPSPSQPSFTPQLSPDTSTSTEVSLIET